MATTKHRFPEDRFSAILKKTPIMENIAENSNILGFCFNCQPLRFCD